MNWERSQEKKLTLQSSGIANIFESNYFCFNFFQKMRELDQLKLLLLSFWYHFFSFFPFLFNFLYFFFSIFNIFIFYIIFFISIFNFFWYVLFFFSSFIFKILLVLIICFSLTSLIFYNFLSFHFYLYLFI